MSKPSQFYHRFTNVSEIWLFLEHVVSLKPKIDIKIEVNIDQCSVQLIWADDNDLSDRIQSYFDIDSRVSANYSLFCDGGSRGNPGPGAAGFVLLDHQEKIIEQGGAFFEECTNNYAEYQGLRLGVEAALKASVKSLQIYLDSELIVKQVKQEYRIRHPNLKQIYDQVTADLAKIEHYAITFIPRKHNQQADQIVNDILDQHLK